MIEAEEPRRLFVNGQRLPLSSLFIAFENYAREDRRYKVSLATFLSTTNPIDLLQDSVVPDYSLSIEEQEDFHICRLSRTIHRANIEGGSRTVQGIFGLYRNNGGNMWTSFTPSGPDFFNHGLLSLLREHRPQITRAYLSSDEIRQIFEEVEMEHNWTITIQKGVQYSYKAEGAINFRKGHFQDLFNEAENEDRYVDKVDFVVKDSIGRRVLHGFISRDCVFYFRFGQFKILKDVFLAKVSDLTEGKNKMFEKRERKFGELALKPIEMEFSEDRFLDISDNERFVKGLSKISAIGLSVMHLNPYLHAKVLDFIDGSTSDIVAINANTIRIVPGFKSSVHSLMRISDGIFRSFDEGIIRTVEPTEHSLGDFLGG